MRSSTDPSEIEQRDRKRASGQSRQSGSVFDTPRDYMTGRARRLANHARDWWLNVDYVESEKEPDEEVIRLLIQRNRRARRNRQQS